MCVHMRECVPVCACICDMCECLHATVKVRRQPQLLVLMPKHNAALQPKTEGTLSLCFVWRQSRGLRGNRRTLSRAHSHRPPVGPAFCWGLTFHHQLGGSANLQRVLSGLYGHPQSTETVFQKEGSICSTTLVAQAITGQPRFPER